MKKINIMGAMLAASVLATGCGLFTPKDPDKFIKPGQATVAVVGTVDGQTETKPSKTEFEFGDMVYVYVTLGWEEKARNKQFAIKWFDAKNQEVASKTRTIDYAKNPHHVWFWINSAQLGQGAVRAELYADGRLFHTAPVSVVERKKLEQDKPWYQSVLRAFGSGDDAKETKDAAKATDANPIDRTQNPKAGAMTSVPAQPTAPNTADVPWYKRWFRADDKAGVGGMSGNGN